MVRNALASELKTRGVVLGKVRKAALIKVLHFVSSFCQEKFKTTCRKLTHKIIEKVPVHITYNVESHSLTTFNRRRTTHKFSGIHRSRSKSS